MVSKEGMQCMQIRESNTNVKSFPGCLDKFVCDTGSMVSRVAPGMVDPAAWLLERIWPEGLQPKVQTFRRVGKLSPMKREMYCGSKFKCRVKKLENLFHHLVVEQTGKLKEKLEQRLRPEEVSPISVLRALLSSE